MSFLPAVVETFDATTALLDAVLVSLVLLPIVYFTVYRPMRNSIEEAGEHLNRISQAERRFSDIAEHASEWIWEVDKDGKFTYSSPVVEQLLGYTAEEALTKHFYDLFHPDDREEVRKAAAEVFAKKEIFKNFINRNVHKDGHSVWLATSGAPVLDEKGDLLGYRGADRVQQEESLLLDPLTGILNRHGFELLADYQLRLAVRSGYTAVLIFADMDNLKLINDQYSHRAGDEALQQIARVLKESLRASDILSRFGGDEFVMLLPAAHLVDAARIVAETHKRLADINRTAQLPYELSISMGTALFVPDQALSLEQLLGRADEAMYAIKRQKSTYRSAN